MASISEAHLYNASAREARFSGDMAAYLVALHDASATFNFCGGMMFQLVLSPALRARLTQPTAKVTVHNAATKRMEHMPSYTQSAAADSVAIFHGREIRSADGAAGAMGMVLHLSDHHGDVDGWSEAERADYDGWGHDGGRPWRKSAQWKRELPDASFAESFGISAYGLHHRFYLHFDGQKRLWLSAEDGCEGYAAAP